MCKACRDGNFQQMGNYFGYPQCCIDNFKQRAEIIRETQNYHSTDNQSKVSVGGFVPCEMHADQIANGEITIESLITERECEHTFPNGGAEYDESDFSLDDLIALLENMEK